MDGEVKEKIETKEAKRSAVSLTIRNVPISVHNKMIKWNRKLNADRQRTYSIMEAYAEFLKEQTKNLEV